MIKKFDEYIKEGLIDKMIAPNLKGDDKIVAEKWGIINEFGFNTQPINKKQNMYYFIIKSPIKYKYPPLYIMYNPSNENIKLNSTESSDLEFKPGWSIYEGGNIINKNWDSIFEYIINLFSSYINYEKDILTEIDTLKTEIAKYEDGLDLISNIKTELKHP